MPVAQTVPQTFTPNPHAAAAFSWSSVTPTARSPMSNGPSGTYVIPDHPVSQMPTTDLNYPLP
eukprot:7482729-Prorocentrum_lima.AAC.1